LARVSSRPISRAAYLFTAVLLVLLTVGVGAALAADDSDIPGLPIAIGGSLTGTVDDVTDEDDVFYVDLTSGQEVRITLAASAYTYLRLLSPDSTSVVSSSYYEVLKSGSSSDVVLTYTPAVSDRYYIWVDAEHTGVTYTLSVTRTTTPAITSPDSQEIPGIGLGNESWQGIVDDVTDEDDVFYVDLTSGQEVRITLAASAYTYLRLLSPDSTSVVSSSYYEVLKSGSSSDVVLTYTPAVSDRYYIWVDAEHTGVPYTLSVTGANPIVTDPILTITNPAGPGTYSSGDSMTVNWTSDQSLSTGEFGVWVRSSSDGWYIGQLVPAGGGTSFSKTIALSVPAGSGYQIIVAYRATPSSTWGCWATSWWSFTVNLGLPYLTIAAPSGSTYTVGDSMTLNWTSDQPLSTGEFGVWLRSGTGSWYVGQVAPATGGTNFLTNLVLNVPAGSGYQAIIAYRASPGSGWVSWATSWWSIAVSP